MLPSFKKFLEPEKKGVAMERGCIVPVSFRAKDKKILDWALKTKDKLKIKSFSEFVRLALEKTRDNNLFIKRR